MMKILISASNAMVYHFLLPHINCLMESGKEVTLVCNNMDGYDALLKSKLDTKKVSLHYVRIYRSPYDLRNIYGILDIKKIIDRDNFDLIWTNEPVMGIATRLAAVKARKRNCKVLYMVHGFHFFKGSGLFSWIFFYPVERWMAHYADALVTINREDFQRGKKFAFKKVYYIHGIGLDIDKYSRVSTSKEDVRKKLNIPMDATMLLSVGELADRKNHRVVIEALGILQRSDIHYVLCGEGVLEDKLKALCRKYNILTNVHFLGYRKDIADLCHAADIYVFPSKREGLGMGALEGMTAGLPLIVSDINGIKDYTKNNYTGFNVGAKDITGFSKAIVKLCDSPDLREKMGEYNQKAVKRYEVNIVKKEIVDIVSDLLN